MSEGLTLVFTRAQVWGQIWEESEVKFKFSCWYLLGVGTGLVPCSYSIIYFLWFVTCPAEFTVSGKLGLTVGRLSQGFKSYSDLKEDLWFLLILLLDC